MVSTFGHIIQDWKTFIAEFNHFSLNFVKKSAYCVPQLLARAENSIPDCISQEDYLPSDIKALMLQNLLV